MKFRVERDVLADAAAWVARSLPARPPVPVLGGVLLEAASGPAGERLWEHCRERLASYKVPKTYEFVVNLTRNDAGKIQLSALAAPSAGRRQAELPARETLPGRVVPG